MATWKDIDINLSKQNDGDVKAMEDVNAVINSITNIFSTLQGERRMLPEFALPIFGLLFEPIDETTAMRLGEMMLQAISTWEDRITVSNIHVNADYDYNMYQVRLSFTMKNSDVPQVFQTIVKAK